VVCDCVYGKVARSPVRYGERERPGARSIGLLINAQVADAPRTVPLAVPYTQLQTAIYAGTPRSGFRKASTGSVPRAVASGVFANGRSLPLAVLTRRLNPDFGAPFAEVAARYYFSEGQAPRLFCSDNGKRAAFREPLPVNCFA
jgi:hypothetical protein